MNAPRSRARRVAAAPLFVLTATLILAACSSSAAGSPTPSEAPSTSPSTAATPTAEPTPTLAPTATAIPSPSEEPGIGSEVIVGDQQKVQVTVVEPWAGSDTQKPAAGNVFISVKITITGITTTSFTSADFAVRDESGTLHPEAAPGRAPHLSYLNGLEPDHFYSGFVTFEVPAAAQKLVLVYTPNFLTTSYEIQLS
jgi:hypothetical protein